jgi:glycosyltransferase involved in cell wall biosynthesis
MLSLNVGGTEKHIFQLVTTLNKNKFNPIVCCLYDLGPLGEQLSSLGYHVYHNVIKNKWDVSGIWKLIRIIRKNNVHTLYTINTPATQFWGTITAGVAAVRTHVTRVTVTKPLYHCKRRVIINKIMLPFADRIIAQAKSHKKHLIHNEGLNFQKIEVICNGIDAERFNKPFDKSALRQAINLPADSPVVGIVARLAPEKGHDILLKAAKKVIGSIQNVRFLIAGDGVERERMVRLTEDLMIQPNVLFLGTRNDIPQIISLFDVAVLTSNPVVETFSHAVLEYMASSKPVVATDTGSTSEIVLNGKTGYVVPCGDSDTLAGAILRILNDRKLAKEMGDAGRELVIGKFTLQNMVTKYESLFIDLTHEA